MKRLLALLLVVLLFGVASAAWAGAKEEVEQAMEQTERAWMAPSPDALIAQFAEDAVYISPTSPFRVEGRKEIGAGLAGTFKAFPTRNLVHRQQSVRIYGDNVAVVDLYWSITLVSAKGDVRTLHGRASQTRVKMGGQWLIVSFHGSLLPQ